VDHVESVWRCRRLRLPLGLTLFTVFLLTSNLSSEQSGDTVFAALPAWQLAQHGTLQLDQFAGWSGWLVQVYDHWYSNRFPGVIASGVPFYAALGNPAAPGVLPAAVAAAFWTAGAMLVLHWLLCRFVSPMTATVAVLVTALATPVWTVSADGLWTHGPAQFVLLLGVALGVRRRWTLAGTAYGIAILLRPHLAFVPLVIGLWHARGNRGPAIATRVGAGSLAGVVALLLYQHAVFGRWSLLGGYSPAHASPEGVGWSELPVNLLGALVSPERGLLLLTPFLMALAPGFRRAWRVAPSWVRSAAVAGLAYGAVQLYLMRFSGGSRFYSWRVLIETFTLMTPLLVLCWTEWTSRTTRRRVIFAALVGLSIGHHAAGAIVNWIPLTETDPWRTLMIVDVLRAAGSTFTLAWATVTAVITTTICVAAYRTAPRTDRLPSHTSRAVTSPALREGSPAAPR
jgi:hypothetical protein